LGVPRAGLSTVNPSATISAPLAALFRSRFAEDATWVPQDDTLPNQVAIKVVFEATFANQDALDVKYSQSHTFAQTMWDPVNGIRVGDQIAGLRGADWYVIGIEQQGDGSCMLPLSLDPP
jgi:hypothetical protein